MSTRKVYIIEDEADIREVIEYNLRKEGFEVRSCGDGAEGLKQIPGEKPNLVILDLMLPGLDGIEVCRQLKSAPETRSMPIIMVTAKGEESDIILGLGMGADDYVTKPFSPKELVARVKAVLRRGELIKAQGACDRLEFDDIVIDSSRHEVLVGDTPVVFTATEFKLLHYLASHPGRVYTRDQLMNRVMGDNVFVIDRNIDVHIRAIRKKLGAACDLVETVRGVGYRFKDAG